MTSQQPLLTRAPILAALKTALEPLDYVYAMWEGGAAAFNRLDEWSDIDVQFDVDDARVDDTFAVIERALATLSPIDLKYKTPQLPWAGIYQWFYRLKNASPYLLIDTAVIQHSAPEKLLTREIHGDAIFYFDKANVAQVPPLDQDAWNARLRDRIAALRVMFEMYQILTLKELQRGNALEALAFYNGYTLRPLVEVLRMRYDPTRYNFHTRYTRHYFPADVVWKLEALFFVTNADDIRAKRAIAEAWFYETLEQIQLT
ncbi:MAG: nucleotidyltransferase domain-containing protein [Chloroflexi bacterium]|nr:nucleotidyltransferase domain-containing protein [Chloroflexota bacterium]